MGRFHTFAIATNDLTVGAYVAEDAQRQECGTEAAVASFLLALP